MRLFALILGLCVLTACGPGQRTNVRDYNFYIASDDPLLVQTVTRLMATFNSMAGSNVRETSFASRKVACLHRIKR